jgi:putative transposase
MGSSWTQNYYHIVFSTKNRLALIGAEHEPRLHAFIGGIVRDLGCTALEINGMADHIHALVHYRSDVSHSDLARHIKSRSTKWMHDTFSDAREFAWQEGYGGFTVSHSAIPAVRQYISHQKEHHKHTSFREEFMQMLARAGIEAREEDVFA